MAIWRINYSDYATQYKSIGVTGMPDGEGYKNNYMDDMAEDNNPDWLQDLEAQNESWESESIPSQASNPFWLMVLVGILVLSLIVLCFAINWWV